MSDPKNQKALVQFMPKAFYYMYAKYNPEAYHRGKGQIRSICHQHI